MNNNYKQWISDTYHCSGCWGNKMTVNDMRTCLHETKLQSDNDTYVPGINLAKQCADYWNKLCKQYPN